MGKSKKPKPARDNRVVVYLSDDQLAPLTQRSAETGAPLSEILRRAIMFYLDAIRKGEAK